MMPRGHQPPEEVHRRVVRYRLWRWIAAAPPMIGSLLILMLLAPALGGGSALLLLAWASCAAAVTSGVGERMVVHAVYGFRRPSARQAAALQPAWATALQVTETKAGDVELYVQTARMPNAYATGGRSVAVTTQVLQDCESGRLRKDRLVAVLVHELGHHATGAVRPMLLLSWLTAPWRLTTRLLVGLAISLGGRHARPGRAAVVAAGLVVAVVHTVQQGRWLVGGVTAFVGAVAVLCPAANAAISRRSEWAADRFAADHGLAIDLAEALDALDDSARRSPRWPQRLWATHPPVDRRIAALVSATARSNASSPAPAATS